MGLIDGLRKAFGSPLQRDVTIADETWNSLLQSSELFLQLDARSRERLRALCGRFLARKSFSAAGGHELDDAQCLVIAALACFPIIPLGYEWLEGWRDIIVYPGEFRVRREHHDEDSGIVTEGDDDVIGEAWDHGPVVLSWADIAADLENPFEGFNVVIHEIAHKLDMLDGAVNGVPRLPESIRREEWIATMQAEYDTFVASLEADIETGIDPYAAESPDEFFAVLCEHYFSCRAVMLAAMPDATALFDRLFAHDASTRTNSRKRGH